MYPSIELASALALLGDASYRRGVAYAREGRLLRCLWDPDVHNLVGNVRGIERGCAARKVLPLPAPPRISTRLSSWMASRMTA